MAKDQTLLSQLRARATMEGTQESGFPGLHYYRVSAPVRFRKTPVFGPRLIVVGQGRKIAKFPGHDLAYDADHYLVITGGTGLEGAVLEASSDRPYLAVCLALSPDVVARTLLALADANAGSASACSSVSSEAPPVAPAFVSRLDSPVESAMVRLLTALDDPLECRVLAPLIMNELVFRLLRTDAARFVRGAVRAGDASIQEAMRYMRENATRALTVEQVARHVGMSDSHFAHRFSAIAQISPMRFLKQVRLEVARELMLSGQLRASEAALEVGYESTSHFTRDFKLAYGAAPAAYVRQARGA